jgi:hypothetical protein
MIIIQPPKMQGFREIVISRDIDNNDEEAAAGEAEPEPDNSMKLIYGVSGGAAALAALLIAVIIIMRKRSGSAALSENAPAPVPAPAAPVTAAAAARTPAAPERTNIKTKPEGVEIRLTPLGQTDAAQYVVKVIDRAEIGRDDNCQVSISDDSSVSSRHCELSWSEGVLYIRDLGSTNGTGVNGIPIKGLYTLKQGDVIGVGRVSLRLGEIREL